MRKAYSAHRGLAVAFGLTALLVSAAGCNDTDERPATWSYISATIIQPNCATSRCHSEGSNVAGLRLETADRGYQDLTEHGHLAGDDPDKTNLMSRLNGSYLNNGKVVEVQRMPIDEPLPQADIDLVRKWLAAGGLEN
jgi:hypothetical protein